MTTYMLLKDVKRFTHDEARDLVRNSAKSFMYFYYNVFGWSTFLTLHPTNATPTGKLKGFPRRVRVYAK